MQMFSLAYQSGLYEGSAFTALFPKYYKNYERRNIILMIHRKNKTGLTESNDQKSLIYWPYKKDEKVKKVKKRKK